MSRVFVKDPDAVLDYAEDWADWLTGDTIVTSTWTVPTGLTKDSDAATTTQTSIWLSGGTVALGRRKSYTVTNHIITAAGREEDRSVYIQMKEK